MSWRGATPVPRWWRSGHRRPRSSPSGGCGWRCCGRRPSSGSRCPTVLSSDYERVQEDVDLASIAARERVTRHDVKARIEEFNALAGHEHVHKGMTSRDLTENVEQLQIRRSLELVFTPRCGGGRAAGRPGRDLPGSGDGRPQPQRRRAGHHAGQAVRLGGARNAGGVGPGSRTARPISVARHQGTDGHGAGHARSVRRGRGAAGVARIAGGGFPRVFQSAGQRRAGVPAVAGPRRRLGSGAAGCRARRRSRTRYD